MCDGEDQHVVTSPERDTRVTVANADAYAAHTEDFFAQTLSGYF